MAWCLRNARIPKYDIPAAANAELMAGAEVMACQPRVLQSVLQAAHISPNVVAVGRRRAMARLETRRHAMAEAVRQVGRARGFREGTVMLERLQILWSPAWRGRGTARLGLVCERGHVSHRKEPAAPALLLG